MAYSRKYPELHKQTAGDTIPLEIELLTDKRGRPVLTVVDAYTFRFTLKENEDDADEAALMMKSSADGGIVLTGTKAQWEITAEESAALPVDTEIFFDVQVTDADGFVKTLRRGRFLFYPQITKTSP